METFQEKIAIVHGDIILQAVDAIVNAANTTLLGGGGVDGAIHQAAGPDLLAECLTLGGCKTGEAKMTKGYRLTARWVIHTVGPVWAGGVQGEDALLQSCYQNVLKLAETHQIKSIALPSISTGAYQFPIERAARIAVGAVRMFLPMMPQIRQVVFVLFSQSDYDVYKQTLGGLQIGN